MRRLLTLALVGFAAQMVDGALGMGYGVTSSSLLIMNGILPAMASASVHMAEVVTTMASAVSHWRMRNVDRHITLSLVAPGAIGAFAGAVLLASLPGDIMKPYVAGMLFLLGVLILVRFVRGQQLPQVPGLVRIPGKRFLSGLGFVAGLLDATGGGGWGPVATTTLLARTATPPRKVIGSVDSSETVVALAASVGFLITMGWNAFNISWLLALMIGGVVAAPLAAWLVCRMPAHLLGVFVGGLIVATNARTLVHALGLAGPTILYVYGALTCAWLCFLALAQYNRRRMLPSQAGD